MSKRLLVILAALLATGTIESCIAQEKSYKKRKKDIYSQTFIKEIPLDKKGKPRSYYSNKPEVEKHLGLNSLENGFDSLQIRLWYGYAFNDSSQLVILKNEKGKWSAEFSMLVYVLSKNGDSILSISKSTECREPNKGWNNLIKKLVNLHIITLPDYHAIPDYHQNTDGDFVIVEVSSKKSYRIYAYQDPEMRRKQFRQARDMANILKLIDREFGFIRLRKF